MGPGFESQRDHSDASAFVRRRFFLYNRVELVQTRFIKKRDKWTCPLALASTARRSPGLV